MKTIKIKIYSFDELTDYAKENAINELSDINVSFEWWSFTFEDAENIGLKIKGFDLVRYCECEFIYGAIECANKIIKEHGQNCQTFNTAHQFLIDRNNLVAKYSDGKNLEIVAEHNEYEFDQECNELENDFLKSISEDYRIILNKEYEYQTSKDAIIESIKSNAYDFTEDGEIY